MHDIVPHLQVHQAENRRAILFRFWTVGPTGTAVAKKFIFGDDCEVQRFVKKAFADSTDVDTSRHEPAFIQNFGDALRLLRTVTENVNLNASSHPRLNVVEYRLIVAAR